jgi:3-oxoacyl-[acyl-carrier protein] reductase
MDLELTGRVAVVTGASAGIGREIARRLAAEGAQVVIVARRKSLLESLQEEIAGSGATRPVAIPVDLTAPHAHRQVRDGALEAFGQVEILVNNAGAPARSSWRPRRRPGRRPSPSTSPRSGG